MCTPVRELQVDFKIHYVYEYLTKLCRTQAEVILNHINPIVRGTGQGETMHKKYKYERGLNLAAVRVCSFRLIK
jgi:hypothetical protein